MNKSLWTGIGASAAMLALILDGKTALEGAYAGIELCLKTVIPSLFPFFVLSILLTGALSGIDLPLLRPIGKLLKIPQGGESILISAFLGGYPAGAQSIQEAHSSGCLSRQDGERMLAFCNNAGPSFLFGMAGRMFPEKWMAWALWGIHILSAILTAQMFPARENTASSPKKGNVSISAALRSAIQIMAQVCGWVVLFRIVIRFLSRWVLWLLPTPMQVAVTGLLELSNGCWELSCIENISVRFVLCSAMLAFGGVCVAMQTASAVRSLSLRLYYRGKLLQTAFSIVLSLLAVSPVWYTIPLIVLFFLIISHKMQNYSGNPVPAGV